MGWGRIERGAAGDFRPVLSTAKALIGDSLGVGFHILKVNDLRGQGGISVTEVHARHIIASRRLSPNDRQARLKLEEIAADIKIGKTTFAAAKKGTQDGLR